MKKKKQRPTIRIEEDTKEALDKRKMHPRQSYNEVITELLREKKYL